MPPEVETMPAETVEPREQWTSIDEYMNTEEFRAMMHREFPENATEWTDPVTRRQFMTLMGASLALAGVTGCSPRPAPNRKVVPYVNQPEQITPGVPLFFATAHVLGGVASGVVVKSQEGRPIKVEGNALHPGSLGGTDVFAQASVLDMYDPDRSKTLTKNGIAALWEDALRAIRSELTKQKAKKGGGVRILTETVSSPTFKKQFEALKAIYPDVKWIQFDTISRDSVRKGTQLAFGKVLNPIYDFTKADVVLSIDCDFTNDGVGSVRYARDFASRRKARTNAQEGGTAEAMNRLYVVESMPSCTGSIADHRLAIRNVDMETFLRTLAEELKVPGAPKAATTLTGSSEKWIKPLAKDLQDKAGKSLVIVGDSQPPSVHALAHAINATLTNINKTVFFTDPLDNGTTDQLADLKTLIDDMKGGKVDLLFVLDANPVYSAPRDLGFLDAMKKVPTRVHLGLYNDETAAWCTWHIPGTHYLETWSDALAYDGTATIMQPLMAPLYNGRSAHELVNEMLDGGDSKNDGLPKTVTPHDILRRSWQEKLKGASGGFEDAWQRAIRDGVVPNTAFEKIAVTLAANWGSTAPAGPAKSGLEISFRSDPTIYDGRYANNGWLQELPKPVTKMCWDNAVFMSPRTAKSLKVADARASWSGGGEHGKAKVRVVEVEYRGKKVKGPVYILPRHADDVITVHLGFGREGAGNVAMGGVYEKFDANKIGFDAYTLRRSDAMSFDTEVAVKVIEGEEYILANTQMHWSMEGRKPVRHATRENYLKDREFAKVPPAGAAETEPINRLVPGPHQNGKGDHHPEPKKDEHKKEADGKGGKEATPHHEHKHDSRLVPLTILPPDPPSGKSERRWAMAIDLTACNGCSACMIACQAENNIPVVGKDQVTRGREMHWIRIDRYYEGKFQRDEELREADEPDNLVTLFQPVPCQQCEKAPCEVVCPVAATVHSADGLNDMVYNRCVGTRYCANNCPYKVRRFNFLTFADFATDSLKLVRNPEVTLRSRGVMEKCTYCVQRIRAAEIEAEREWHLPDSRRPKDEHGRPRILDGEIVTACQAACPSGCIVFGDIADPTSKVNRWKAEPTNYGLLAELNTMPRTTYLATIRNPNPELAAKFKKEKGA